MKMFSFVKGWLKDSLHPNVCHIEKISLLRLDVDSYSATMEALFYLYDKVSDGGVVIFDDCNLWESYYAMRHFFEKKGLTYVYSPDVSLKTKQNIFEIPLDTYRASVKPGSYMIKGEE